MTTIHSHVQNAFIWRVLSLEKVVGLRIQIGLVLHSSLNITWRNSTRFHSRVRYLAILCAPDL